MLSRACRPALALIRHHIRLTSTTPARPTRDFDDRLSQLLDSVPSLTPAHIENLNDAERHKLEGALERLLSGAGDAESLQHTSPSGESLVQYSELVGAFLEGHISETQLATTVAHGRWQYKALQHLPQYRVPVALVHYRSFHPELLKIFGHFVTHVASALAIPLSNPASLPTQRSLWTVPKSPFVYKKNQENFERTVHKRVVKAWDAHPEVVERFVRYIEHYQMPGVGLRVVQWVRVAPGIGEAQMATAREKWNMRKLSPRDQVKALGDKIVKEETDALAAAYQANAGSANPGAVKAMDPPAMLEALDSATKDELEATLDKMRATRDANHGAMPAFSGALPKATEDKAATLQGPPDGKSAGRTTKRTKRLQAAANAVVASETPSATTTTTTELEVPESTPAQSPLPELIESAASSADAPTTASPPREESSPAMTSTLEVKMTPTAAVGATPAPPSRPTATAQPAGVETSSIPASLSAPLSKPTEASSSARPSKEAPPAPAVGVSALTKEGPTAAVTASPAPRIEAAVTPVAAASVSQPADVGVPSTPPQSVSTPSAEAAPSTSAESDSTSSVSPLQAAPTLHPPSIPDSQVKDVSVEAELAAEASPFTPETTPTPPPASAAGPSPTESPSTSSSATTTPSLEEASRKDASGPTDPKLKGPSSSS